MVILEGLLTAKVLLSLDGGELIDDATVARYCDSEVRARRSWMT